MTKTTFNTQIEYIVISDGSPMESVYLPPNIFQYNIINYLKILPKNVLQLIDATKYYEYQLKSSLNQGYDLKIINIKDWELFDNVLKDIISLKLFFFNGKSEKQLEILETLILENNKLNYFCFYNYPIPKKHYNIVLSPFDFFDKILDNQKAVLKSLGIRNKYFDFSLPIEFSKLIKFDYFLPARNNIYTINNSIGNFYFSNTEEIKTINEKSIKISNSAIKNKATFNRQEIFNEQLKNLDALTKIAYRENIVTKVSGVEPEFSPIILVAPFHNPDFKANNKELDYALTLEQTSNYTIDGDSSKTSSESTLMGIHYHKIRLEYLDDLSYLHSSFCFSPSIRLPIKGKSLYRELSFFGPKSFNTIATQNARKKLLKSINNFGKKFTEATISPALQQFLKIRNSQIVAISDLPIEWINIDEIPLSFTHDICRIPETSLHGLMSHYVTNQNFKFSINKEILNKTLIILGCHDENFMIWHEEVYKLQNIYNFQVEICNKNEDVKNAINKYNPELLIFDCHGGVDLNSNSTYLMIGNEKLDSRYVVDNNITAPLVFLSACGTAPTYGTMDPIANAFFEAGALSVTSTFLPISIHNGSILYLRLLNKLQYASNQLIHKNWLEFISHIIRTSTINDAYLTALRKNKQINISDYHSSNVSTLIDSLQFNKRRKLYKSLDMKISQMAKNDRDYYSSIIPEYLLYTNLGRSDLILFDNWKEENYKKNVS